MNVYEITVPPVTAIHGYSSNFIVRLHADSAEEAAVAAVKKTAGWHWGPHTVTSLTREQVAATGRVHPAPQDEVVVAWEEIGRLDRYVHTVTVAKPRLVA